MVDSTLPGCRAAEGRAAETERRLAEAHAMVSQFAAENARLAAASEAAASRRTLVDSDYKSAMAPPLLLCFPCSSSL